MSAPEQVTPSRTDGTEDVTAMFKDGEPQQNLMEYLSKQMVPVPDFTTPPSASDDKLCAIPPYCDPENVNDFRSAGVLLKALAAEARAWSQKLPPEFRPAIVAVLHGGLQIQVRTLAQVSFDGIRIEGIMGDSPCSLLAHQDTIQLVCHAVHNEETEDESRHNPIGFIWPDYNEEI